MLDNCGSILFCKETMWNTSQSHFINDDDPGSFNHQQSSFTDWKLLLGCWFSHISRLHLIIGELDYKVVEKALGQRKKRENGTKKGKLSACWELSSIAVAMGKWIRGSTVLPTEHLLWYQIHSCSICNFPLCYSCFRVVASQNFFKIK